MFHKLTVNKKKRHKKNNLEKSKLKKTKNLRDILARAHSKKGSKKKQTRRAKKKYIMAGVKGTSRNIDKKTEDKNNDMDMEVIARVMRTKKIKDDLEAELSEFYEKLNEAVTASAASNIHNPIDNKLREEAKQTYITSKKNAINMANEEYIHALTALQNRKKSREKPKSMSIYEDIANKKKK